MPALPIEAFITSPSGGTTARPGSGQATPVEVQATLRGVAYPASKTALLGHAERAGASAAVRAALSRLPERQYEAPTEVSPALGQRE